MWQFSEVPQELSERNLYNNQNSNACKKSQTPSAKTMFRSVINQRKELAQRWKFEYV